MYQPRAKLKFLKFFLKFRYFNQKSLKLFHRKIITIKLHFIKIINIYINMYNLYHDICILWMVSDAKNCIIYFYVSFSSTRNNYASQLIKLEDIKK